MKVPGTPLPAVRGEYAAESSSGDLVATVRFERGTMHSTTTVSRGAARARFAYYLGVQFSGSSFDWADLRALLLDLALLANPSLITSSSLPESITRETPGAALLNRLRARWTSFRDGASTLMCDACREAAAKQYAAYRRSFLRPVNTVECTHHDLWRDAWRVLATGCPELMYSAVGLTTHVAGPDGAPRWVLTQHAFEGALSGWLGAQPVRDVWGSRWQSRTRRWLSARRAKDAAQNVVAEAMGFAATAWGDPGLAAAEPPVVGDAPPAIAWDDEPVTPIQVARVIVAEPEPKALRSAAPAEGGASDAKKTRARATKKTEPAKVIATAKKTEPAVKDESAKKAESPKKAEPPKKDEPAKKTDSGNYEQHFTEEELKMYFPAALVKRELAAGRLVKRPDGRYVFVK